MSPRPFGTTGPSSPDASNRRAATPTELVGTTTVTGASGSACLASATALRSVRDAARPYALGTTVIATERS